MRGASGRLHGLQLNASTPASPPLPVQAPDAHPAQLTQRPPGHSESLVHQHGTPTAVHWPPGDVTSLQLPIAQDHSLAAEVAVWQASVSDGPVPVHTPTHCPSALTHLPLEQSESATQRQAVCPELMIGAGVRVVVHAPPPLPMQATEVGVGWQP